MREDYKVKTSSGVVEFDGDVFTTYKKAKMRFDELTSDIRNGVISKKTLDWCELIYSPVDGDPDGNDEVIEAVELTFDQKRIKSIIAEC